MDPGNYQYDDMQMAPYRGPGGPSGGPRGYGTALINRPHVPSDVGLMIGEDLHNRNMDLMQYEAFDIEANNAYAKRMREQQDRHDAEYQDQQRLLREKEKEGHDTAMADHKHKLAKEAKRKQIDAKRRKKQEKERKAKLELERLEEEKARLEDLENDDDDYAEESDEYNDKIASYKSKARKLKKERATKDLVKTHLKNKKAGKKFAKHDKIINKTYNVDDYQPKNKDDLDQGALAALPDSIKAEVLGGIGKSKKGSSGGRKKGRSKKRRDSSSEEDSDSDSDSEDYRKSRRRKAPPARRRPPPRKESSDSSDSDDSDSNSDDAAVRSDGGC